MLLQCLLFIIGVADAIVGGVDVHVRPMLVRGTRRDRCRRAIASRVAIFAVPDTVPGVSSVSSIPRTVRLSAESASAAEPRAWNSHLACSPSKSSATPWDGTSLGQSLVVSTQEEEHGTNHERNERDTTDDATSNSAGVVTATGRCNWDNESWGWRGRQRYG